MIILLGFRAGKIGKLGGDRIKALKSLLRPNKLGFGVRLIAKNPVSDLMQNLDIFFTADEC